MFKHDNDNEAKSLNRRTLLAGIAAATASGSVTAATPVLTAGDASEDPLVDLVEEYFDSIHRYNLASKADERATKAARAAFPPLPPDLQGIVDASYYTGGATGREVRVLDRGYLEDLIGRCSDGVERMRRYEAYDAACARVEAAHGVPQAEALMEAISDEQGAIIDEIRTTPAPSLAGLVAKLRFAVDIGDATEEIYDDAVRLLALKASPAA